MIDFVLIDCNFSSVRIHDLWTNIFLWKCEFCEFCENYYNVQNMEFLVKLVKQYIKYLRLLEPMSLKIIFSAILLNKLFLCWSDQKMLLGKVVQNCRKMGYAKQGPFWDPLGPIHQSSPKLCYERFRPFWATFIKYIFL